MSLVEFNKNAVDKAKDEVKRVLGVLNEHLKPRTYLVGERLTLADIYLFAILDSTAEKSAAILEHFPSVKKLAETVKAIPHVAKWLESRPVTAM